MARWFAALLAANICMTSPTRADERSDRAAAASAFKQGIEFVDQRRFEEAALAFERAHQFSPTFEVLRNIGRAWTEARRYSLAIAAYDRYLTDGGSRIPAALREQVQAEQTSLAALTSTLSLTTVPPSVQVSVDGKRVGLTPLSELRVDAGQRVVRLETHGFQTVVSEVLCAAGTPRSLHYELRPVPQPSALPTRSGRPASSQAVAAAARNAALAAQRADTRAMASRRRNWGYLATGAGAALGVATGLLVAHSQSEYSGWQREQSKLDEVWGKTAAGEPGPKAQQAQNDARANRIQLFDQVATGTGVGAVALLAAGIALLFSAGDNEPPAVTLSSDIDLTWRGRF